MQSVSMQEQAALLVSAASNSSDLTRAYSDYIQAVLRGPLWSVREPGGVRIPWRSAKEARDHPELADSFNRPGLYLFGSEAGVPLYLGMTTTTLWKRLSRRYVRGARSQCQLAVDYEQELVAHGVDGFPEEIRAWYRRDYGSSTVRLEGAKTFAEHGIQGIWFTLIPTSDPDSPDRLEQDLMPLAQAWNRVHDHPALLNVHFSP